jgi:EAL domain-containing protein (putative c-di-GMP-specific phosphodiesterase class I)
MGGDEFVLLLREVEGTPDALDVASKALAALREPFRVHQQELYVTPSIGIAIYPEHGNTAQMLITRADAAMYNVKKGGRNDVRVFATEMSTFFPERLMLENDLRRALERHEFELHYQPKVELADGSVVGMEALVRWRHPRKGLVSPDQFIPLAEESGLIVPIGRWVIEEACRQNKAWQDSGMPHLRVAVNISGLQFRQKDLLESIGYALGSSGLAPECLEVEITESVVMQNASDAIVTLERLSAMGVHVSIDDFGTGYSSLSYLKRFPIDKLKIDRSFIRDVSSDMEDAAIVRATIGLAHNLRLRVVAEGVETAEQLEFLRALGCDEYQGYYKSKPVAPAEFERVLRAELGLLPLTAPAVAA